MAPSAVLCGDVSIDEDARIPVGAVLTAEVFGLSRAEAAMERLARRYSQSFGRHRGDRVLRTLEP